MASKQTSTLNYETLLGMIPFVIDFLDLDSEEIIGSGILDDDELDDAAIAFILSHKRKKKITQSSQPWALDSLVNSPLTALVSQLSSSQETQHGVILTSVSRNQMDDFRLNFRMTEPMFSTLLQDVMKLTSFAERKVYVSSQIYNQELAESTPLPMEPAAMLMLTLQFLGCQQSVGQLAERSRLSESIFCDVVHETINALYELLQHYIKWPEREDVANSLEHFRRMCGLPGVLGVIDVLHIPVEAPAEHAAYYINLENEATILLQTVSNHKLHFLHCCTGWPGSVSETSVLRDSDLYSDIKEEIATYFPSDSFLVGDEAYTLTEWLMIPYKDDGSLSSPQRKLNTACKAVLHNNKMAYTVLMKRFPRLEHLNMKDTQVKVVMILVCCALHNFCLDQGDFVLFEDAEVTVRNINNCNVSKERTSSDPETSKGEAKRQKLLQKLQQF